MLTKLRLKTRTRTCSNLTRRHAVEEVPVGQQRNDQFFARSTQSLEESLDKSALAFLASYGLVGAILLLGAIGYLLDEWLGSTPWLLIAGLVAGIVIGFSGLLRIARRR